jgi:Leucine-rich repeat (LRR) protein
MLRSSAPADTQQLIDTIESQTDQLPNDLVFVLDIVSVRFGGYFTQQIQDVIEKFSLLQMLTLNDCGIKSLENFPHLPGLLRLDLVFNEITGESLQHLKGSRHLQTLMLGANKIDKF